MFGRDFNKWHRLTSEFILQATSNEDPDALDKAIEYGVRALKDAGNDLQRTLALSQVRTAIDMRGILMVSQAEKAKEVERDVRQGQRDDQSAARHDRETEKEPR